MIETFCLIILGYLIAVFQSSAGVFFQVGLIRLDAIPALICWYSLRQPLPLGMVAVAVLGLFVSVFSTIPMYVFPLSYVLGFLTIRYIISNVLELYPWQIYLLVGFLSLEIIVVQLAGSGNTELVWPWGLLQSGLNAISAPVFFFFFNKIDAILKKMKRKKRDITNE